MKNIALLGSTGSIGTQTLEVIKHLNKSGYQFKVVALAGGENIPLLAKQIKTFNPLLVSVKRHQDIDLLRKLVSGKTEIFFGEEGLAKVASIKEADIVLNGLVGSVGLVPSLAALRVKKTLALANKESLVIGGHLIKELKGKIIPVDSEHSALFQLLQKTKDVSKIILTASGGAVYSADKLSLVTPEDVLKHPTWRMGKRITVDSATLANKAFEVIEAHWLFEMPYERIDVLIHPQAVVHGLVELADGSLIAHLSYPDMRIPIQYALTHPQTQKFNFPLDLTKVDLSFSKVDHERYPAFSCIVEGGRIGGTMPAALNAADEVLVERFLRGEIAFTDISRGLQKVLEHHQVVSNPNLEEILAADRWGREYVG